MVIRDVTSAAPQKSQGDQGVAEEPDGDERLAAFSVGQAAEIRQEEDARQGKGAENHADVQAAGPEVAGIDRQQGHHDPDAGDGGEDGKKEG